jgi:hypothetical protein
MVAPAIALAPTLGGILTAGLSLAGKEILKAFLAKGSSDFLNPKPQQNPMDTMTVKRRADRTAWTPTPTTVGIPLTYDQTPLAQSPILQAYFGRA